MFLALFIILVQILIVLDVLNSQLSSSVPCLLPFFPQRNPLTHKTCLGETSVIEDRFKGDGPATEWAGGGGGGGGATFIFHVSFMLSLFLYSSLSHHEHIPSGG